MESIILILPYFGKLPKMFSMFLKTVEHNDTIDFLIVSDCEKPITLPSNVKWKCESFAEFKNRFQRMVYKDISLDTPYKLCDYKPLYGYILSELISEYEYWGYCDCDLIWGDLRKFLDPIIEKKYDKIFSCGHLTLIKNSPENNKLFMDGEGAWDVFKEVCTSAGIHGFDEDFFGEKNIQQIFLDNGRKIYWDDFSINPRVDTDRFFLRRYSPQQRKFVDVSYENELYYWENGHLYQVKCVNGVIKKIEFAYMHYQLRKMNGIDDVLEDDLFKIVPNSFIKSKKIPSTLEEWKRERKLYFGGQRVIQLKKRVISKIRKVFKVCR